MRGSARRDVDDCFAPPGHAQPAAVGDGADDGRGDVPLGADGQEVVEPLRRDDRHHPFLRLAHQDLFGRQRRVTQRDDVEVHVHPAGAGRGQFGGGARQPGGAEIDTNFGLAARSIPNVDVLPVQGINVYDILRRDKLVLTRAAVDALEARFK